MGTLYIIGNGFDLHHGLTTSLKGFRDYSKSSVFGHLYENGVFMMQADQDPIQHWNNLEENLANLDIDELIEQKSEYYDDDPHKNEFLYEVEKAIDAITSGLVQELSNYLIKAERESIVADSLLELDTNAYFINFNYTNTLERVYGVKNENICYIHGKLNSQSEIVIGHAMKDSGYIPEPKIDISTWPEEAKEAYINAYSPDYESALEHAHSYFKRSYKDTDSCLAYASNFLESLCGIDKVIILGHSLAEIDQVYFEDINRKVGKDCLWWASCYSMSEKRGIFERLEMIVGEKNRICVFELSQLKF